MRPGVTSSSSLKKTRSLPEPGFSSSKLLHQPQPSLLSPVPTPTVPVYTPRPPVPTPDAPREDLTERLRKEFGLSIEDSEEGEEGSDTEPAVLVAGGPDLGSSYVNASHIVASAHRPTNHVEANNTAADTNHSWAPISRAGTANHGSQPRSSGGGHNSPGGSTGYWADVSYRNSFRQT